MASSSSSREIAKHLDYLREIGFDELYLPASDPAQRPGELGTDGGGDRHALLAELEAEAAGCSACALSAGRKRVVFGSGHSDARLMFIGEGPGAEEDRQGLPFVGPAGELLTKIIEAIGMRRDEVYIANVVKCRPPGNRDPLPEESRACWSFLEQQIRLVQPEIIVALGRVAAQNLLDTGESLGRLRGRWHHAAGVPVRVTYHPAALLRNPGWKRPTWEDMQEVRDRLLQTNPS